MFHLATSTLTQLLASYGYLAVLLFVAIKSTGIPFPGETILLVAAITAGTTHQLSIAWVIVAAPAEPSWATTWASGWDVRGATACCAATGATSAWMNVA